MNWLIPAYEALEASAVHSVCGRKRKRLWKPRARELNMNSHNPNIAFP
jgi:hypothetical protein